MGKTLKEFISVEEVEKPEEEEPDEERDADLAEEDTELTIFKFKVRCEGTQHKK